MLLTPPDNCHSMALSAIAPLCLGHALMLCSPKRLAPALETRQPHGAGTGTSACPVVCFRWRVQGCRLPAPRGKHLQCNLTLPGRDTDTAVLFPCLCSHLKPHNQNVHLLCVLLKHEPLL